MSVNRGEGRPGAFFATVGGAAVLFGVLVFLGTPHIRRLMSGVH